MSKINQTKSSPGAATPSGENELIANTSIENISLSDIPWFNCKNNFLKAKTPEDHIILAKDVKFNEGAKNYTWLSTVESMIHVIESTPHNKRHYYEFFPDANNYSTYMFFDIDREINVDDDHIITDIPAFEEATINMFLRTLQAFLREVHKLDFNPVIGSNVQLCHATSSKKISIHARVNIKISSIIEHYNFALNFEKYITSNLYIPKDSQDYLTFTKVVRKKNGSESNVLKSIVDTSVYAGFKGIRTIYSSKYKDNAVTLTPYLGSSPHIKDHLVLYYPNTAPQDLPVLRDINEFQAKADFSKKNQVSTIIRTVRAPEQETQTNRSDYHSEIPLSHLELVEKALQENEEIQDVLGSTNIIFRDSQFYLPHIYYFMLDKSMKYNCPYKCGREGDPFHRHNRSYFQYNYQTHMVKYKCFNEICKSHPECYCIQLSFGRDLLNRFNDITSIDTLHCKRNMIEWDEEYEDPIDPDDPKMKPYPLKPICLIVAGMGLSKTREMTSNFLPQHCMRDTKCLFITYSRMLANKYANDLQELGFVNYLDRDEGSIYDQRVIVCLDSLPRVKTTNFDFVIIDEITSVLAHFNSEHMKYSGSICDELEKHLLQASHIYAMDAAADNTIVHDFFQHISTKKNVPIYYIRNKYVRKTNRKADIYINKQYKVEAVKVKIFKYVEQRIRKGKKVVITSSTRAFVEELESHLKHRLPSIKVTTYHSGNNTITSPNVVDSWVFCDALIYSPTISAGLSYEQETFDELVAYMDNSFWTPAVDNVLQQLFRVRKLKTGKMSLYINSTSTLDPLHYPTNSEAIDQFLDDDTASVNRFFEASRTKFSSDRYVTTDGVIRYDKDRLSYKILRGIILNKNKSILRFPEILMNTLQEDYGIPCTIKDLSLSENFIMAATKLIKLIRGSKGKKAAFIPEYVISTSEYEELAKKQQRGDALDEVESQQKWVYDCATNLWGIRPSYVDEYFYNNFIGTPNTSNAKSMINKFFRFKRFMDMVDYPIARHIVAYKEKLESCMEESDFKLYQSHARTYYDQLIEGQRFLEEVFTDHVEVKERLRNGEEIHVKDGLFIIKVKDYIQSLSDSDYSRVVGLFSDGDAYDNRKEVLGDSQKLMYLTKAILGGAFNIEMGRNLICRKKESKMYDENERVFQSVYKSLKDTYRPQSFCDAYDIPVLDEDDNDEFDF